MTDRSAMRRKRGEQPALTLDRATGGSRVQVLELSGGAGSTRQLSRLQIRVGAVLEVRRAAPWGGPVLVEAGGSTVAVGRGLASKVRVRVLS